MRYISKIAGLAALLFTMLGCIKENTGTMEPGTFEVDKEYATLQLEQYRQTAFIPVRSNIAESEWEFASTAPWCQVSRSITAEKGIMVAVDDNTDKEEVRRAQITVRAGANEFRAVVYQFGYGPAIIVSPVTVGPEGGEVVLDIVSNVELDETALSSPAINADDDGGEWIRYAGTFETRAFTTRHFRYEVETNEMPDKRVATLTVKALKSEDSVADTKCTITQNSIAVTSTEIFSDSKLNVLSVRANQVSENEQAYGNGSVDRLIDGSYETYYHSPWPTEGGGTVFPVVWEFELFGDQRIDYINVMHRSTSSGAGAHWRGQIGKFNVYYKVNPTDDYTLVNPADAPFDFGGNGGYQTAYMPYGLENATWVKIEILDGDPNAPSYNENPYIATAEVEFYNSNRSEVNGWIDRIFTDRSCSELRSGVSKRDIIQMNAVSPFLASNVAMPLLNGTYDANEYDFRAHSYEPYSDNHVNRQLVTRLYTMMDNPTGIEVKNGQDILVCVDKVPAGQTVSLAVYGDDGTGPNYGGGGENEGYNQNTVLVAGVNTIRIQADGMAYVMNTASPLSASSQPVKVHILPGCGTVQGYFDPARHDDAKYKDLLNRCTYKYFLVKGSKCMFLFHTNQLRSDWPSSIRSGIGVWDDIVAWQHELMGLDKKEWFNNHIMAVTSTSPDVYMNASHRRVQFGVGTIAEIGSREKMLSGTGQGTVWGPAHEIGHVNQMGINWRSSTESSNNLFSNYAVYKISGDKYYDTYWSRGDKISALADSWADAKPWCVLGNANYQNEDTELHCRMNWQLWNYYYNCGYKTDFWPTLFELLRQDPLPGELAPSYYGMSEDPGAAQLQFYEKACDAAGEDLTEFFETWGFFRAVDRQYEQYGTVLYRVTDQMINASRARVRDKGYPKAAPMQYLEDRTSNGGETYSQMGHFSLYKNKTTISKTPKATVTGRHVSLSDADQAVAVEVRRGSSETGELLYFSNMFSFDVPQSVSLSGNSLWAVQYDGKRVKVNQ